MIEAVLFDLFGTLIADDDIEEGTRNGWAAIHAALTAQGLDQAYDTFAVELEREIDTPLAPEDDRDPSIFVGKLMRLQRHCGLAQDREIASRAAEACVCAWGEHVYLADDAIATLAALSKSCKLGLVTNFDHPPFVHATLAHYGLARWFDVVAISAELRIDKPDPRIFGHVLSALGADAPHTVMVGDNLVADIAGAEAVGCRAILIDRWQAHSSYQGERVKALKDLLGRIQCSTAFRAP